MSSSYQVYLSIIKMEYQRALDIADGAVEMIPMSDMFDTTSFPERMKRAIAKHLTGRILPEGADKYVKSLIAHRYRDVYIRPGAFPGMIAVDAIAHVLVQGAMDAIHGRNLDIGGNITQYLLDVLDFREDKSNQYDMSGTFDDQSNDKLHANLLFAKLEQTTIQSLLVETEDEPIFVEDRPYEDWYEESARLSGYENTETVKSILEQSQSYRALIVKLDALKILYYGTKTWNIRRILKEKFHSKISVVIVSPIIKIDDNYIMELIIYGGAHILPPEDKEKIIIAEKRKKSLIKESKTAINIMGINKRKMAETELRDLKRRVALLDEVVINNIIFESQIRPHFEDCIVGGISHCTNFNAAEVNISSILQPIKTGNITRYFVNLLEMVAAAVRAEEIVDYLNSVGTVVDVHLNNILDDMWVDVEMNNVISDEEDVETTIANSIIAMIENAVPDRDISDKERAIYLFDDVFDPYIAIFIARWINDVNLDDIDLDIKDIPNTMRSISDKILDRIEDDQYIDAAFRTIDVQSVLQHFSAVGMDKIDLIKGVVNRIVDVSPFDRSMLISYLDSIINISKVVADTTSVGMLTRTILMARGLAKEMLELKGDIKDVLAAKYEGYIYKFLGENVARTYVDRLKAAHSEGDEAYNLIRVDSGGFEVDGQLYDMRPLSDVYKTKYRYDFKCTGSNIMKVAFVDGMDMRSIRSSFTYNLYELYGIDAARTSAMSTVSYLSKILGSSVNPQNIIQLVDYATSTGFPRAHKKVALDQKSGSSLMRHHMSMKEVYSDFQDRTHIGNPVDRMFTQSKFDLRVPGPEYANAVRQYENVGQGVSTDFTKIEDYEPSAYEHPVTVQFVDAKKKTSGFDAQRFASDDIFGSDFA